MEIDALHNAVRALKLEHPELTVKEVHAELETAGQVVELSAVKKACSKVTKQLAQEMPRLPPVPLPTAIPVSEASARKKEKKAQRAGLYPVADEATARAAGLNDAGMANLRQYESRAAAGDSEEQYQLGCSAHMIGEANAAVWLKMAAEQGHVKAQYNLGCAYKTGEGFAPDLQQSANWFRTAAEQGHMEAQCNLGLAFCKGQGVRQSYADAKTWFEKAAAQGDTLAQMELRKVVMALAVQERGHSVMWSGREIDTGF